MQVPHRRVRFDSRSLVSTHTRVAVVAVALAVPLQAQPQQLELILERLRTYLSAYEAALSVVVADEAYEQRMIRPGRPKPEVDPTGALMDPGTRPTFAETTRRRLQSTVSFLRLPGGAAWLGVREVQTVDKRTLANSRNLLAVLTSNAGDAQAQAAALAYASIQHNLGPLRTVNMPTLPLELLDSRHRDRMLFQLEGSDSVRGVRTARIAFEEKGAPTLIRGETDNYWVISRGVVWIDATSGAIWRAHVFYRDYMPDQAVRTPEAEVFVDFARNTALGMLVPEKMREVFHMPSGRGEGEAKYSNYRRFTTSARIIPQN